MNEIIATANNNDYLSKNELLQWINDLLKVCFYPISILNGQIIFHIAKHLQNRNSWHWGHSLPAARCLIPGKVPSKDHFILN